MKFLLGTKYRIIFNTTYERYYAQVKFWYWPIWWFNIHESGEFLYDSSMWSKENARDAILKWRQLHKIFSNNVVVDKL